VAYPVLIINKKATTLLNAVIRKIIIVAEEPTRISATVGVKGVINGSFIVSSQSTDGNVDAFISAYQPALDPLNFGYTAGTTVVAESLPNVGEVDVNLPLDVTKPIMIGLCTNEFVPSIANIRVIIDYY
jgi:hypothetical protein